MAGEPHPPAVPSTAPQNLGRYSCLEYNDPKIEIAIDNEITIPSVTAASKQVSLKAVTAPPPGAALIVPEPNGIQPSPQELVLQGTTEIKLCSPAAQARLKSALKKQVHFPHEPAANEVKLVEEQQQPPVVKRTCVEPAPITSKRPGNDQSTVSSTQKWDGKTRVAATSNPTKKAAKWQPKSREDWASLHNAVGAKDATLQAFVTELMNIEQKKTYIGHMAILSARIGGHKRPLKVLVDTGASGNFISMALVNELQLAVRPLKDEESHSVVIANGQKCLLHSALSSKIALTLGSSTGTWRGNCTGESSLLVLPHLQSYDIILGTPFCRQWEATLCFKGVNPTVELIGSSDHPSQRVTLTANTGMQPASMSCSYNSWREMISGKKAEEIFLCLLSPEELVPEVATQEPTTFTSNPPPPEKSSKVEAWDNLHEEIDGVDPSSPIPDQPPDEFEPLRQKILDKHKDILKPELPAGGAASRAPDLTHKIPFTKEGEENPPAASRPRPMNPKYNDELKRVITYLLESDFIRPSSSPFGSAVLFAKKKDGSLRFCVDYRAINAATKKDRYPIPNIQELLDRLDGAKYFSTIDLASGYWQIKVDEVDIEKTAFQTRYGAFEFIVMPFGLTGAPSTFQRIMNKIFGPEMDDYLLVYLDDILIFSKTIEEHEAHLDTVLTRLKENKLVANSKKCRFFKTETEFLGHIVSAEGIKMDPAKVAAITALAAPRNITDVRAFLGAANFYRRFIEHFATIAAPLTDLLRGGCAFIWSTETQSAFGQLKVALSTAPVLHPPDMTKPFHLYTDASLVGVGGALMQWTGDGKDSAANLAPIAYVSRVLSQTERRWATHERELFSIVYSLKQFRHYLLGSKFDATVRNDHKGLQHFDTQKDISPKQARWLEFLQEFDIAINYVEGKANLVADMLSRLQREPLQMPTPTPTAGETAAPPLQLHIISTVTCDIDNQSTQQLKEALQSDKFAQEMIKKIEEGKSTKRYGSTFFLKNELLYRQSGNRQQLYVPMQDLQTKLLQEFHDTPFAGHMGRDKTIAAISEQFWWPSIFEDVKDKVKSCRTCQLNKPRNGLIAGKLMPLRTPDYAWQQMTLDLMGPFPETEAGLNYVVVFVDRFSKMIHVEPYNQDEGSSAKQIADIFHKHVFKLHGLPTTIVSDRDPRWTGQFWEKLFSKLNSRLDMSTAFHPQTDGQTENANKNIQQVLRNIIGERPEDWAECLPAAEFAINNACQASTGLSPFEICNGRKPTVPAAYLQPLQPASQVPAVDEWIKRQQEVIELVRTNLGKAQQRQKQYTDRKRSDVQFEAGQLVKLVSSALKRKQHGAPAFGRKLSPRFHGPFKIEKMIGPNAAVLELPGDVNNRKHRTFNVDKLAVWHDSDKFPRENTSHSAEALEDLGAQITAETRYIVEAFVDVERRKSPRGRLRWEALVKWQGYTAEDNTWEPVQRLKTDLKDNFLEFYTTLVQSTGEDPLNLVHEDEEDDEL